MPNMTEPNRLHDVLKWEQDNRYSREQVTVLSGEDLDILAVVGKITSATPTTGTADGGNTGDGTCTTVTAGVDVQVGDYTLECVAAPAGAISTPTTGTADGGNTGDGTCTAVTAGASALAGTYTLECVAAAADAGTFKVTAPDGDALPDATVAVAYANAQLNFTLNDGATDFAVGDIFTILASAADGDAGTFSVLAPDGDALPDATVGTAYSNAQLNFTLNDGATDFAVGDKFTVTVAAGSGKVVEIDFTAVDGSQNAYGFLIAAVDASAADVVGVAIVRDAIIVSTDLVWPTGATAGQKTAALAQLQEAGIIVRSEV